MNVNKYANLIPRIQDWIEGANLDALVLGLGPTAWLVRHMRRKLIRSIRLFGAHDVCRIITVNDLVLLDTPYANHGVLGPDGERHAVIVNSRPDRLWVHAPNLPPWDEFIHPCMRSVLTPVDFKVWDVNECSDRSDFHLGLTRPSTMMVSPIGCTTLAWHEGCRRIGVLGMDMMHGHHHTGGDLRAVALCDTFMCKIANEAQEKGGAILNLSPITALQVFAQASLVRITTHSNKPVPV